MKFQILTILAVVAALLVGCMEPRQNAAGAPVDTDRDVLTGGPVTGTTIDKLPEPVKNALRECVPAAEIADIDKVTRDEQVVYQISLATPGRNPRLVINENGSIVTDSGAPAR